MDKLIAWMNGVYLPLDEMKIGYNDLGLLRGYAVFDFLRTNNRVPVFLEDYLQRFQESAAALRLHMPLSEPAMRNVIRKLVELQPEASMGLRLLLTGGYSDDAYTVQEPNLMISPVPIKPVPKILPDAVKIITHPYERQLPQVKSIHYTMGILLQQEVKAAGAFDVLYHSEQGVSEFPRSNVFIVTKQGELQTPAHAVLKGITRKRVIQAAANLLPVQEKNISLQELYDAEEIFITSTTKKIIPVTQVDDKLIGAGMHGPITSQLFERLSAAEENYVQHFQW